MRVWLWVSVQRRIWLLLQSHVSVSLLCSLEDVEVEAWMMEKGEEEAKFEKTLSRNPERFPPSRFGLDAASYSWPSGERVS